jgi:hypothetical protein
VWAHGRPRSIRGRCATCAHGLHLVPRLPTFALSGPLPCPLRVRPDARPARRCCPGPVRAALDARPAVSWTLDSPASAPSSTDVVTPTGHRARRPPAAGVGPLGEGPTGASAFDRRKALTLPAAIHNRHPPGCSGSGEGWVEGPSRRDAQRPSGDPLQPAPSADCGAVRPPPGRCRRDATELSSVPIQSPRRPAGPVCFHLRPTLNAQLSGYFRRQAEVANHAGGVRDALRQLSQVVPCPVAERLPQRHTSRHDRRLQRQRP